MAVVYGGTAVIMSPWDCHPSVVGPFVVHAIFLGRSIAVEAMYNSGDPRYEQPRPHLVPKRSAFIVRH